MKKLLLLLSFAGILAANDGIIAAKDGNVIARSFSTAVIEGTIVGALNIKSTNEAIPILKAAIAPLSNQKPSRVEELGIFYGLGALPTILADSKMQNNLSGDTLKKGCAFLISWHGQANKLSDGEREDMESACVVGYAVNLVGNSEKK